ncbi:hypothetical protein SteCoe_2138 [Stentor coeruleus]|uniref:ODAD1 central coiled coil region domain-containing protein n=1 Tax=Stentor coeruleus TaxID=5963 RepID=A0A1R2D071_9CILI|nr:hypothetical protein SteCoe_2138 [Stentor coeruleus]
MLLNQLDRTSDFEEEPLNQEEETSEIAAQLSLIRKRHDRAREINNKKRIYYEKLKAEIETANASSNLADQDLKSLQYKIEMLKNSLEQNRYRHECEMGNKRTYLHMLDRMKKDKIAMEIKANSLQISLKNSRSILNTETDKFRKIRENQYQSKQILQEIKQAIAVDQKRKNDRIIQLEKNVKERQDLALRREERQKRQADISEAAANDDKDSQEAKIRESLLANRLWFLFLRKKLEKEVVKGVSIEQAFQKIKAATGVSDINEIVEKFLTREESYGSLVTAVNEAEKKLEALKEYNSQIRDKLVEAQLDDGGNNRKIYSDIEDMEGKLSSCYKEYAVIKEKLHKSVLTYDQVLNWGFKILHTLEIENTLDISPGSKITETKNSLEEMFSIIYCKLEDMVKPLQDKAEEAKQALEKFAMKKTNDIVREISAQESLHKVSRNTLESGETFNQGDHRQVSNRDKTPEIDRRITLKRVE